MTVTTTVAEPPRVNLYEGMFLVSSSKYANDPETTVGAIMEVLERAGADVVAHRPWQDGKLAYEIEGHRKGLHYLVCFKMDPQGMEVLTRQSSLNELIIRQMVVRHTPELFNAMVDALTGAGQESEEAPAEEAPAPTKPAGDAEAK